MWITSLWFGGRYNRFTPSKHELPIQLYHIMLPLSGGFSVDKNMKSFFIKIITWFTMILDWHTMFTPPFSKRKLSWVIYLLTSILWTSNMVIWQSMLTWIPWHWQPFLTHQIYFNIRLGYLKTLLILENHILLTVYTLKQHMIVSDPQKCSHYFWDWILQ
jgi:hypothetical protein